LSRGLACWVRCAGHQGNAYRVTTHRPL